jgi:hypothetical protein
LAATKGPEAVAKLIDKRLSALERARSFIEWEKVRAFEEDLLATVGSIVGEPAPAPPEMAIDRLLRFLATSESVLQRVDDSRGSIEELYAGMAASIGDFAAKLGAPQKEALERIRRKGGPAIRYMRISDLADGSEAREPGSVERRLLQARILEAQGDKVAAQKLRWNGFETTLDVRVLRAYVEALGDFEEFDALDRAFDFASASKMRHLALEFFLKWPRLDRAARLVFDHRRNLEGSRYEFLAPAAETLEHEHPAAATVLYRALLDDILARARSNAYWGRRPPSGQARRAGAGRRRRPAAGRHRSACHLPCLAGEEPRTQGRVLGSGAEGLA